MNLLEQAAAAGPDHTAVEDEHGREPEYAELFHDADRLATRLARWGVERGDRVGLWLQKASRPSPRSTAFCARALPMCPSTPPARPCAPPAILASSGVKAAVVAAELAPALRAAWAGVGPLPRLILVEVTRCQRRLPLLSKAPPGRPMRSRRAMPAGRRSWPTTRPRPCRRRDRATTWRTSSSPRARPASPKA